MAKQKIVIKLSMKNGQKYRTKALMIAASVPGNVLKVSLEGDEKDKVEVIGEGVDAVELTRMLRKGFGFAHLETVSAVEDKDKDDKDKDKDKDKDNKDGPICWSYGWGVPSQSVYNCRCYLAPYCSCSKW